MKKFIICILFTLVMVFSILPMVFAAEVTDSGTCGENLTWSLDSEFVLTISGTGSMTDFTADAPAPWHESRASITAVNIADGVMTIGDYAFYCYSSLTSITVPDSVTKIGEHAFEYCYKIKTLSLGKNLQEIGDFAFSDCSALQTIPLPQGLKTIGTFAFEGCNSLESITIPDSVTELGESAFKSCSLLTSAVFPGSIGIIPPNAFFGCERLKEVTLEEGITGIGAGAFGECDALLSIAIPQGVTVIDRSAFILCKKLAQVTLPQSLEIIYDSAFYDCSSLIAIELYDNVTTIGNYAFSGCKLLEKFTASNSLESIGEQAFEACLSLPEFTIPATVTSIGEAAFKGCAKMTKIIVEDGNQNYTSLDGVLFTKDMTELLCHPGNKSGAYAIPNSVEKIEDYGFYSCTSLTGITIPDNVTYIGDFAFYGCVYLDTAVTIPAGVTLLGNSVFKECYRLPGVVILSHADIPNYAFSQCEAMTTAYIAQGVAKIGSYGFSECTSLKGVYFYGAAPTVGSCAFTQGYPAAAISGLTLYYIDGKEGWTTPTYCGYPTAIWDGVNGGETGIVSSGTCGENLTWTLDASGLLTISGTGAIPDYEWGESPFHENASIKAAVIEAGVTAIGSHTFYSCPNLVSVTAGDGLTSIGKYAFYSCESLRSAALPNSVKTIAPEAFSYCTSLAQLTLPASLESIGYSAFARCISLKEISIPAAVNSIGYRAFEGCSALTGLWVDENNNNYTSDAHGVLFNKKKTVLIQLPEGYSGTSYAIPEGVVAMDYESSVDCDNLTSISLPASFTHIPDYGIIFGGCNMLEAVWVDENNQVYSSDQGVLLSKDRTMLRLIPKGYTGAYVIPDTVTYISGYGVDDCTKLTSITIPASFVSLPDHVHWFGGWFNGCTSLKTIWVDENNERYASDEYGVLFNKEMTQLLRCPAGFTGEYTAPASTEVIEEYAFEDCALLTRVTLMKSLKEIKFRAFFNCSSLDAVYFYGDAPVLGEYAFYMYSYELEDEIIIPGLTLYYIDSRDGWSFPTWNGYPASSFASGEDYAFDDVPLNAWYVESVEFAVEHGLMNGVGNRQFDPEGTMTRAMLVTVLWRYAGSPTGYENIFTDLTQDWYKDAVAWAAANSIVNGVGNGKFDPDGSITREQMATILFRYSNSQGLDTAARDDLSAFPDASKVTDWALEAMQWCVAEKLISGTSNNGVITLNPLGTATRAEVATILMRYIENLIEA